jgi:hypothetical protein
MLLRSSFSYRQDCSARKSVAEPTQPQVGDDEDYEYEEFEEVAEDTEEQDTEEQEEEEQYINLYD